MAERLKQGNIFAALKIYLKLEKWIIYAKSSVEFRRKNCLLADVKVAMYPTSIKFIHFSINLT